MLRTLPRAIDTKTVAVVRALPAKPHPKAAPRVAPQARGECTPFPAAPSRGGDDTVADGEPHEELTSAYRTGSIIAGKYRLMRPLGRGGMGEVWSAEHLALNTEVAVKFLSTGAGGPAKRLALERFRFEAQVSAHLGLRTAHVVAVHDAGSDASGPYLVMEYVRGHTLRVELNRQGQIDLRSVADIIDQVAEALSVAHAFGIVHRDLKPSNLLLVERGDQPMYVKVADFGIAKALRANLAVDRPEDTKDGWMLGSPAYMSPEQMSGQAVDPRTDMWSLGVIAYEALTGRLPFPGRSVGEIIVNMSFGRFDPPSKLAPWLPGKLDDWFLRALSKKKEHRFRTMAEMAREFRRAMVARPPQRLGRIARGLAIAMSLSAALIGLRPAPSKALPEVVPSRLPAALVIAEARPGPPPTVNHPAAAIPEAAPLPGSASGARPPSVRAVPVAPLSLPASASPPLSPARGRVLTEVF